MSSSMLAGERRWASARRGGMTVLGKVAVPKPLNLPSQRLENHGLDPNVEIVPKGSLSWGSRSSASNPWGSSVVSPNADGAVSPSHLIGRPSSSGGSGTRPSTAGSDRMHEAGASAWGPNSRPSSASGPLTSNQTSLASSRPRSAETRPGSSQLSRFAEPVSDNSVAWGSTGTMEKLVLNAKSDNFSLSSGDFPTLGKNPESEDNHSHGRPGSASGRVASPKERAHTDVKGGTINTWTRDGAHHVEDGVHSSTEKWHGDHPQYLNPNIPPQHFDWRGPPMNAPAGVWYRGPPGGPPYPPVAHGGFPIEPFPYYRPQIPPALANPQPVPPRGPGPRGHHPKNGDFYRPQMPDAFIRPGMPMRPGFYPGPVPYDGYYGPPMGYNPNEREIPFMGMPAGPPVYNMYPPQNSSEPGDIQVRAGSRGSGGKRLVTEHAELSHSDDARGPYKVLKKRQNEWGLEEEEANMEPTASANALYLEKGEQSRTASLKNEWGADNRRDEELYSRRATLSENHSSRTSLGHQGHSSDSVILKSPRGKSKAVDESWGKKSEIATPQVEVPHELPAALKDTTLIQKIESLNAKVRAFGGREDVEPSSVREDQKNRVQLVNTKANHHSLNEASSTHISGDSISSSQEVGGGSTGETTRQATADSVPAISRRAHPGVHGRVDHQNKGRFNNHDSDGWRKKSPSLVSESSAAVPAVNVDHTSSFHAQDHHVTVEVAEKSEISIPGKNEEEAFTPMFDPTDGQAQRAKMRELAKQRAIQLQKEEEERIKEQKAKALAKLEELNRRTLAGDSLAQKLETPLSSGASEHDSEELQKHPDPVIDAGKHVTENLEKPLTSGATQQDPEESQKHPGPVMHDDKHAAQKLGKSLPSGAIQRNPKESRKQPGPVMNVDKCELPSSISTSNARVVAQTSEKSTNGDGENSVLSKDSQFEAPKSTQQVPIVLHGQSLPSKLDVVNTGAEDSKAANDVSLHRHKRNKQKQSIQVDRTVSDKPKQSIQVESTVTDKSTPISSGEALTGPDIGATEVVTSQFDTTCVPSLPNNSNIMSESVGHNRRKNSRRCRNKHKLDEVASCAASQSPASKETHSNKASAFATSQSPVTKESHSAKPSGDAASPSAVSKETYPANASASAASQSPVKKETLTVKASATAASQSLVQKETLPAKASAFAASQLVSKETHPATASLSASSQAPVPKETLSVKALPGRGQPKASELDLDPNSVQLVTDVKDANQQPGLVQSSSLPSEEADSRVTNQWKPQNSRRVSRNPQALRSGDKFYGTESVVWAPVRSQNKLEHEGEASQKAVPSENKLEPEGEASQKAVQSQNKLEPEGEVSQRAVPDVTPPPTRSSNPVQTIMKSKRAEMERYVPKAVAKELAQQGSIQQPVTLSSSVHTSDEISEREGSGSQSVKPETGNVGSSLEPRNGNVKQSKQQTRTQGSWCQRGSSEAQHGQGFQQGSSSTSNPSKNVKKSTDQQDTPKPDLNFLPAENKVSHDWDPSDGWNMPEEPIGAASVTYMVKDEGKGAGKGRRHHHKGHRSTMNSHDLDHRSSSSGGEADNNYTQFAAPDISQTDRVVSFKESRASHWQPKSQAYSANNQRGSRSGEGQNDSSEVKKNSPPQGRVQTTLHDIKESSEITHQPPLDQYVSGNKNVGEASNVGHEEARRERGPAGSRRQPRTPNQSLGPPDNMDEQAADQHYSSASRRSGIQNNRSGRGNESRRDWSSGGQDNRPQHVAPSRERHRQSSHFEYQPVGSNNNNGKSNNFDGPTDGSRNMGSRERERGSGRPRGRGTGNFHGQLSGSIRVEAGND